MIVRTARDEPVRRRTCLLALATLVAVPDTASALATAGAKRPRTAQTPRGRTPSTAADTGKRTAARSAPPPARPSPRLDVPLARSRAPHCERRATANRGGPRSGGTAPARPPKGGDPSPPARAPATDTHPRTATNLAAPPAPQAVPQIDGPPPPSRRPGWDRAPVPHTNALPPIADRRGAGLGVSFGVPTSPQFTEGQSFGGADSAPQARQQQQGGPRLPSPGATVRFPF
jgi:hypothetical protein